MAMTRASRNVGLRTIYDPQNPPAAAPTAPYRGQPDPYGREPVNPPGYEPGGNGPIDQGPGSSLGSVPQPPDLGPGSSVLSAPGAGPRPLTYEPGGGYAPYDPLTSISTGRPYGEAGYAMPPWSPPTPPPRPAGLGGVLSRAVVPAAAPARAAPAAAVAAAPAAQPQSSMFTGIDRQNSGPNDRFRGGGTALNLSGLLGGLFGGGGAAPSPAPPPPPAAGWWKSMR